MYLKKTWEFGNRIAVKKYHTARYGVKGEKREKRKKLTGEQMRAVNERNARRKLKMLMVNNFFLGDWHLTLTYAPDKRCGVEESKKIIKAFFRKLRSLYRKSGIELRYIMVTEWESKSLHHHIAINDIPGIASVLAECWLNGGAHLTPLYADCDYTGLADYFVKETSETFRKAENPYKQRWTCSRNLKKPDEHVEVVDSSAWRQEPHATKAQQEAGYILLKDSIVNDIDSWGYPFQEYELIRYTRIKQPSKRKVLAGGQKK